MLQFASQCAKLSSGSSLLANVVGMQASSRHRRGWAKDVEEEALVLLCLHCWSRFCCVCVICAENERCSRCCQTFLHLISAKKGGPDPPEENETNLGELRVAVGQETHSQDNC